MRAEVWKYSMPRLCFRDLPSATAPCPRPPGPVSSCPVSPAPQPMTENGAYVAGSRLRPMLAAVMAGAYAQQSMEVAGEAEAEPASSSSGLFGEGSPTVRTPSWPSENCNTSRRRAAATDWRWWIGWIWEHSSTRGVKPLTVQWPDSDGS